VAAAIGEVPVQSVLVKSRRKRVIIIRSSDCKSRAAHAIYVLGVAEVACGAPCGSGVRWLRWRPTAIMPTTHTCAECSRSYSKAAHLSRHIRAHANKRSFACDLCQKAFNRRDVLARHRRLVHPSHDSNAIQVEANTSAAPLFLNPNLEEPPLFSSVPDDWPELPHLDLFAGLFDSLGEPTDVPRSRSHAGTAVASEDSRTGLGGSLRSSLDIDEFRALPRIWPSIADASSETSPSSGSRPLGWEHVSRELVSDIKETDVQLC
jgi:hypothetical protein